MARSIKKLSTFDKKIQKEIIEMLEEEGVKMVDFPYKGEIERGIIYKINEEDSYLVVLDKLKSTIKMVEDEDEDEEDDDDDEFRELDKDIKGDDDDIETDDDDDDDDIEEKLKNIADEEEDFDDDDDDDDDEL
ncbi:MAG: hypothetical protein K0B10_08805 [Vicingaceae bacterium]|nr:hypothetical protein [Vicingaceae bacterium]